MKYETLTNVIFLTASAITVSSRQRCLTQRYSIIATRNSLRILQGGTRYLVTPRLRNDLKGFGRLCDIADRK